MMRRPTSKGRQIDKKKRIQIQLCTDKLTIRNNMKGLRFLAQFQKKIYNHNRENKAKLLYYIQNTYHEQEQQQHQQKQQAFGG